MRNIEKIKISIIIPVYNSESYLSTLLESVLDQTYSNVEIILIDDGSTDASKQICDSYEMKDNRFKVISKNNEGICPTRNLGISLATGDYIAFFDNDDLIEKDYLRCIEEICGERKPDIITFGYRSIEVNENNVSVVAEDHVPGSEGFLFDDIRSYVFKEINNSFNPVWCKLYRRDFLNEHKVRFNEQYRHGMEDIYFNVSAFSYASIIYVSKKIVYNYYVRDNHSISRKYNPRLLNDSIDLFIHMEKSFCIDELYQDQTYIKNKFQYLLIATIENEVAKGGDHNKIREIIDTPYVELFLSTIKITKVKLNRYQSMVYKMIDCKQYKLLGFIVRKKMKLKKNAKAYRYIRRHFACSHSERVH